MYLKLSNVFAGLLVVAIVAGCGDGPRGSAASSAVASAVVTDATPRFAAGPLGNACLIHDRRNANTRSCGCVQAAANLTLSQQQQQRGVRFFSEPELIQQVRLSDSRSNQEFWQAWQAFAETAEALCADL